MCVCVSVEVTGAEFAHLPAGEIKQQIKSKAAAAAPAARVGKNFYPILPRPGGVASDTRRATSLGGIILTRELGFRRINLAASSTTAPALATQAGN